MDFSVVTSEPSSVLPGIAGLLALFVMIAVAAAVVRVVTNALSGGSDDD